MPFPIAYVAGQFPKRSETFVFNEVRALRARGWTVHTFGLHAPDEETPADLRDLRETTEIVYAGSGAKRLLSQPLAAIRGAIDAAASREKPKEDLKLVAQAAAGASLGKRLRALGVRHVRAHFAHAPTSVAMYAARAAGVSFSFTGHANDLFQRRQALALKLKRAAFVGCISEWHRDLYRSIVPGDDAKYPVIRCGVDIAALAPTPHPRGRRVLSVARLVEKKGIDTLVRAAVALADRGTPIEVVIGGEGPMRAELEAIAKPQAASIRFLGPLSSAQVREELGRADAFALPCRVDANGDKDGIPVVLMEAMAAGVPVVSGDLPAIRELVADRKTGLLVPGGDANATADAIAAVLADDGTLAEAGRRKVVEEFSIDGTVLQLERAFERAVAADNG